MKVLSEYDSNRKILKESVYLKKKVLDYEMIYKYDLNGNLIEELVVYPNDNYRGGTKYEYDSKGKVIKEHISNSEDLDRVQIPINMTQEGKEIEFYSFLWWRAETQKHL